MKNGIEWHMMSAHAKNFALSFSISGVVAVEEFKTFSEFHVIPKRFEKMIFDEDSRNVRRETTNGEGVVDEEKKMFKNESM